MSDQANQSPDKPDLTVEKKKKRPRRAKKKNTKSAHAMADTGNNAAVGNNGTKSDINSNLKNDENESKPDQNQAEMNTKKQRRIRFRDDRYFGRFRCKSCAKTWDSACVFCIAGTKKVKFRQRCKHCTGDDSWVFPHFLRILECRTCGCVPCECLCEDCGKLKHLRVQTRIVTINSDDGTQKNVPDRVLDDRFEYCDCEKTNFKGVGDHIDDKKPHRSDLCEKCLKGWPCTRRKVVSEEERKEKDNEP